MFTAYVIVAVVLAAMLLFAAYGKYAKVGPHVELLNSAKVPREWYWWLALLDLAGAAGLVLGIWVPWIGLAAAVGVTLYFVGAAVMHVREGDSKGLPAVAALAILAAVALWLRLAA